MKRTPLCYIIGYTILILIALWLIGGCSKHDDYNLFPVPVPNYYTPVYGIGIYNPNHIEITLDIDCVFEMMEGHYQSGVDPRTIVIWIEPDSFNLCRYYNPSYTLPSRHLIQAVWNINCFIVEMNRIFLWEIGGNWMCESKSCMGNWIEEWEIGCPVVVVTEEEGQYLTWDANKETDLAGYVLYWGSESREYTQSRDVGLSRVVYLNTLDLWDVTYFAVTAYDTSGNESDYSKEVSHRKARFETVKDIDIDRDKIWPVKDGRRTIK